MKAIIQGGFMKRIIQGLMVFGFVICYSLAVSAYTGSYTPGEGINNTPHDLPRGDNGMNYQPVTTPADTLNRICIYCHAPHNTYRLTSATGGAGPVVPDSSFDYLPLWNHSLQTDIAYTMYDNGPGAPQSGPKASQAILNGMIPGSTSLLCLSCHDGSVAVNEYGNSDQIAGSVSHGTDLISTSYRIGDGKYLGNHHPIGFSYSDALSGDPELRTTDTPFTIDSDIQGHLYGTTSTLECGTCHSVHNKGNTGETLLWRSDQNSELCLTCHAKGIYTPPL
jgi:predicted CXXCH cytochrome family protein